MDRQAIQQLCQQYGIRGGRAMGQNFLCSPEVLGRIMRVAGLESSDTVLEVGPGLGVLTERLALAAGRVVAVELDRRLAQIATERLARHRNVTVVLGDILTVPPATLALPERFHVVANVPYQITAHFLRQLYGDARFGARPVSSVLMLQREVAQRLAAGPGRHSLLSLSVQLFADVRVEFDVPKINFWPIPKVDSAVVSLRLRRPNPQLDRLNGMAPHQSQPQALQHWFGLLRAGFSSPRKQLHNNVRAAWPALGDARTILQAIGVAADARAQALSLEQWLDLAEKLKMYRNK